MTALSYLSGALTTAIPPDVDIGNPQRTPKQMLIADGVSKLAFALFGVITAYFMKLGIDPAHMKQDTVLTTIASPFITLVTAAVTYLASQAPNGPSRTPTGVGAFLITTIICFDAMFGQLHG